MKKIKLAYLFLGIGIGIVLVNNLYFLFPEAEHIELSDEAIIERAKELGYISLKESISRGNENKEEESKENINLRTEDKVNKKEKQDEKSVEVEIKEGDNLSDIADKLYQVNIIKDKKEFISLAQDKTVDKKFAYGVFDIKYNTSYEAIINLLIR